ncbi:MAG: glycosyltransferase family 39 protein [Bauldia sp.]
MKRLATALADAFEQRPEAFFVAVLAVQVALWTLVPAFTYRNAPIDVMENIGWGREWQLGYASHPPLQAWLTMAAVTLGGGAIWPAYVLSQVAIALTFVPLYLLGREAGGAKVALFAVVIYSLVFYANLPTPEFNANVVQMPIWAFAALALWRAIDSGRLLWWVALGVIAALAVYAKYSAVILFGALILASLAVPSGRRAYRTIGPYVSVALALVLIAPHLRWLWSVDFLPVTFAEGRAGRPEGIQRLIRPFGFLGAQLLDHLLPALLLLASGIRFRQIGAPNTPARDLWRFILVMAFAPYALSLIFSVATGYGLRDPWGAPMPAWISLVAALVLLPVIARLPALLLTWGLLFVLMPIGLGVVTIVSPHFPSPLWQVWPGPAMASQLTDIWRAHTGNAPLRIVAGDKWAIGIVTVYAPEHPHVLTDARYVLSPWVTPADVARDGALLVWQRGSPDVLAPEYAAFGPFSATGALRIPFAGPGSDTADIGWAIKPPG